jgi:hypothetical protein
MKHVGRYGTESYDLRCSDELGIWDCSLSAVPCDEYVYQLVILDSVVDGRCCGYGTEGSASLRFHAAVTILTCSLRQENYLRHNLLSAGGHRVKPLPPVLQSLADHIRIFLSGTQRSVVEALSPGMDNSICLAVFSSFDASN